LNSALRKSNSLPTSVAPKSLRQQVEKILEALSSYGLSRKLTLDEQTLYFAGLHGLEFLDTCWKMKRFAEIFGDKKLK